MTTFRADLSDATQHFLHCILNIIGVSWHWRLMAFHLTRWRCSAMDSRLDRHRPRPVAPPPLAIPPSAPRMSRLAVDALTKCCQINNSTCASHYQTLRPSTPPNIRHNTQTPTHSHAYTDVKRRQTPLTHLVDGRGGRTMSSSLMARASLLALVHARSCASNTISTEGRTKAAPASNAWLNTPSCRSIAFHAP